MNYTHERKGWKQNRVTVLFRFSCEFKLEAACDSYTHTPTVLVDGDLVYTTIRFLSTPCTFHVSVCISAPTVWMSLWHYILIVHTRNGVNSPRILSQNNTTIGMEKSEWETNRMWHNTPVGISILWSYFSSQSGIFFHTNNHSRTQAHQSCGTNHSK